ncbi:MAG: MFS transporter [Chloroflexi bacterium]|nr:MFS transporter [Chloroflexota bacterium]
MERALPPNRARSLPASFGYWIVVAAFVAQFMSVGTNAVSGAFLKPMSDELGWSRTDFTYALTLSRFLSAFVGFFIGVYVDRYGSRPLMLVGTTVVAASLFLMGSVAELWQWLLLRGFMMTVGSALIGGLVVNVTLSRWWVEKRAQMIGLASMGVSGAGAVFPPLVTVVIHEWGWRAGWHVMAAIVLSVYAAALVMRRQPEDYGLHPDGRTQQEIRDGAGAAAAADYANSFTRREAVRTSTFYLIVLAFGLSQVGSGAMLLQTIPFLTDQDFSPNEAALLSAVMSLFAMLCKPAWGWMAGRMEPNRVASICFVQSAVAMVIILIAAEAHAFVPLTVGFVLMGWGFGGAIPLQETIWASYFGRRYIGAVRSAALPVALFLGAGAPLAVSAYYDAVGNYRGIFFLIAGLWLLAAVLSTFVRRPQRPAVAEAT